MTEERSDNSYNRLKQSTDFAEAQPSGMGATEQPQLKGKPMIILTGPTSVGKTRLSILLAKAVGGEILSADSVQVYEYMDIGSAKIKREEMEGVPHHLIDVLKPWDEFNVVVFQKLCKEVLEGIYKRGRIPVVVGGTGFYIQALLRDIDFTENQEDAELRRHLERKAAQEGPESLHALLREVDPASAEAIHCNNVKRTIRALEYFYQTGQKISEHNEAERKRERAYRSVYFVLNDDREKLYQRIEERVDEMMREGLLEEVRALKDMGCTREMVSMQGLGYKEILDHLDGECTLEEAVNRIKLSTRHFAKRQLTWFRREKDVIWIQKPDFDYDDRHILAYMLDCIRKAGILQS